MCAPFLIRLWNMYQKEAGCDAVEMKKKELILEGLDCANCSLKIENEMNALDGVKAEVNFATKTLTLTYGAHEDEDLMKKAEHIVHRHEPDVVVKEKRKNKTQEEIFLLEGLGCANCAMKMEEEISKLPAVESVSIDFATRKLRVLPKDGALSTEDKNRMSGIIETIEKDTKLILVGTEEKQIEGEYQRILRVHGKDLSMIVLSGLLLLAGALIPVSGTLRLLLFLLSYLLVGGEIVLRAVRNLVRGQVFDENFLMAIATIGAFIIGEYAEGVAVMLFYQVGELFQSMAVERSRRSIADLMDIRPEYANLIKEGTVVKVSPEEVKPGDVILVKPGEKVPLDGVVVEGASSLNTSALTGESMPRDVESGSEILSGFINQNGLLKVEVTKEFGASAVSKILELVENASGKKAPTESFISKFARYYTPFVVVSALLLAVIPPMLLGDSFSMWAYRALVFLVISCPCALVVSIPLGFFGGIGGASRRGVLVKGGNYLEALNEVETVVFDKTGTLTEGKFTVTRILPEGNLSESALLEKASYVESFSSHPISLSIVSAYGKELDRGRISSYEEIAGHGIKASLDGKTIFAGNRRLMEKEGITVPQLSFGGTLVYLSEGGQYIGALVISDTIKKGAMETIQALKDMGIRKTVMLTGDLKRVGEEIGTVLGLDEVYTELLPQDKVSVFERLKKETSGKIVFVGDGINDAPVLAQADIGISMGSLGSDAAIEASDVVLMTDEPMRIVTALKVARRTRSIVWQNIVFALGVKGIFLLLGALGVASMWEAVFADVGVTVIAVLNAMRVMKTEHL